LKSKRAAATALLSGESQVEFLFELQEFYKNSGTEYWVISLLCGGEIWGTHARKYLLLLSGSWKSLANKLDVAVLPVNFPAGK